ncbi:helix-turn-helix transcriptional regulator [Novosphingobium sp. B 225]|uniref:helix-turn-helix transcriptional regulator n=1 Tax=Novosphingobium sp. B 225 TaxID=1961849 RepID=UPI000B4BA13A|nr:hypothetical protein [Novosphingobium sp. B 225]
MAGLIETADFNAVVSDIYEASLSPAHWDLALTGLVNRFGRERWDVAMLVWERVEPGGGRFIAASGVHEMARAAYLQLFAGRNLWSVHGHHMPIGSVTHSDQLVARADFLASPFYRDFLSMFGMEVALLGSLDRQASDHLGLCLPGPSGCDVSRLQEATGLLIPHIQRAVRISRRIGEAELAAANSQAALDHAPSAVLLLDERLGLVYANPNGRALIEDFHLADAAGQLHLPSRDLREALLQLTGTDSARYCHPFRLQRGGLDGLAAMAMRINPDRVGGAHTAGGTARVMVVAAHNPKVSEEGVDRVREWFGLTHAEARLALLLAEGGRIEDYCDLRGVSVNAARFLLKGIFAKTGCNRQAQVVQLINASPIHWASGLPVSDLPQPVA